MILIYAISRSKQFTRDYKLAEKKNLDMSLLDDVILQLAQNIKLDKKYKNHSLSGKYAGTSECHIQPNWLLVYKIDISLKVLYLIRTGTHSDLF